MLDNRLKFLGFEGLCVLLQWLTFPNQLQDLTPMFGRTADKLSRIVSHLVKCLGNTYHGNLRWDERHLNPGTLTQFAAAIHAAGSPLKTVFRFINRTVQRITQPTHHQRKYYGGFKRYHAIKFQGVVGPDGIIFHLEGHFLAPNHDITMYRMSNLEQLLQQHGKLSAICFSCLF